MEDEIRSMVILNEAVGGELVWKHVKAGSLITMLFWQWKMVYRTKEKWGLKFNPFQY
jgi:hypothetical protein